MRVLHVVASMNPENGGVSKAVQVIVDGLQANNVQSEVISLDAADASFLKELSFTVWGLGPGKSPWSYSDKWVPWLSAHVPEFTTIIIHGLWLYSSFATEKALRRFKRKHLLHNGTGVAIPKLFVMPHGMLDPYFQQASSRRLKAFRNWAYWKLLERHAINNADGLLFTCEEEKLLARLPFYPYKPKQEIVIGLGTEGPAEYIPAMKQAFLMKCPSVQNQKYFLYLSRIHPKKGIDLLLSAYSTVCSRRNISKYSNSAGNAAGIGVTLPKLVIAGPGLESDYGQQMLARVKEDIKLRDAVYFTGMLTGDAKWGAFYGCDAFILPSHQENFGIAVVEAMACRKPVMISDKVNIWREIKATESGLVAGDTQQGIEDLLCAWMNMDNSTKSTMGINAHHLFEHSFSIARVAKQLIKNLQ